MTPDPVQAGRKLSVEEVREKFWRAKLAAAEQAHHDELRKMRDGSGASLSILARYAKDIERAKREIARGR